MEKFEVAELLALPGIDAFTKLLRRNGRVVSTPNGKSQAYGQETGVHIYSERLGDDAYCMALRSRSSRRPRQLNFQGKFLCLERFLRTVFLQTIF